MTAPKHGLKRDLGFWDILMFGIGSIVGAGIYAIIGEVAGPAGSMLWVSFTIAALVALLTGLSYAEFVSRYPDAGGSFEYVKQVFGLKTALFLSFIILFTGVVAPAAIAISFSEYLGRLLEAPAWVPTIGIIVLMTLINIFGIQQSSWFNILATVVTLIGLGAVVWFAVPDWGSVDLMRMPEQGATGLLAGAALIFFSYVGFEDLVKVAEETREPEKTMPRGIILSGIIVLITYLLIAVSAVSVLGPEKLGGSDGPLAQVIATAAGPAWATALIVIALFATSKTILSNIMGTSRMMYDLARDTGADWLSRLTHVNSRTKTPIFSILFIGGLTIAFSLIGNLKTVAAISNIFALLLFLAVNVALIRLRLKEKAKENTPFRVPLNVRNVPLPTVLAVLGLLILLGFNIYNLV